MVPPLLEEQSQPAPCIETHSESELHALPTHSSGGGGDGGGGIRSAPGTAGEGGGDGCETGGGDGGGHAPLSSHTHCSVVWQSDAAVCDAQNSSHVPT